MRIVKLSDLNCFKTTELKYTTFRYKATHIKHLTSENCWQMISFCISINLLPNSVPSYSKYGSTSTKKTTRIKFCSDAVGRTDDNWLSMGVAD